MPRQGDAAKPSTFGKKYFAIEADEDVWHVGLVLPHHVQRIIRNVKQWIVHRINEQQIGLGHGNQFVTFCSAEVHE